MRQSSPSALGWQCTAPRASCWELMGTMAEGELIEGTVSTYLHNQMQVMSTRWPVTAGLGVPEH